MSTEELFEQLICDRVSKLKENYKKKNYQKVVYEDRSFDAQIVMDNMDDDGREVLEAYISQLIRGNAETERMLYTHGITDAVYLIKKVKGQEDEEY